uniref:Uncharacterized protein n=1 Tax=Anguilla anguilla TaxID=7936 RepID=A0A0E9VLC5_ANGAN
MLILQSSLQPVLSGWESADKHALSSTARDVSHRKSRSYRCASHLRSYTMAITV